jgi:ubiquitin carboxyl-terminal hydrolase 5/13
VPEQQEGIAPGMFKRLVGRGHPEFSTAKQQVRHFLIVFELNVTSCHTWQDVLEYYRHVLKLLERHKPELHGADVGELFRFKMEDRLECNASHQVELLAKPLNSCTRR